MAMSGLGGGLDSVRSIDAMKGGCGLDENPTNELVSELSKKLLSIIKNLDYSLPKASEISR